MRSFPADFKFRMGILKIIMDMYPSTAVGHSDRKKRSLIVGHNFMTTFCAALYKTLFQLLYGSQ
jgi:hypothetical protein